MPKQPKITASVSVSPTTITIPQDVNTPATVHITGSGFPANSTIGYLITESDGDLRFGGLTVTDGSGNFTYDMHLDSSMGIEPGLTKLMVNSGRAYAETTFTVA